MKLLQTPFRFVAALAVFACLGASLRAATLTDAYAEARAVIAEPYKHQVVSVYGTGTNSEVTKWWFIFYDPATTSHGRVIIIENGRITKASAVDAQKQYLKEAAFDPAAGNVPEVGLALRTTADYAKRKGIAYSGTRVLLRRPAEKATPIWRVELVNGTASKGFVYTQPGTGGFANYESKAGVARRKTQGFFNDVGNTFLGVGGDLEEFFTGERTVDK